jgi:hypothetical protein
VAVGGALLVASLAASCASNDSRGATNQQSTTIAPTTVAATTAAPTTSGQAVRGKGYRVSVPTSWRDVTSEVKPAGTLDLAVVGPETEGVVSNVNVTIEPTRGLTLADMSSQVRKGSQQSLPDARLAGRMERLRVDGAPAMAYEFTFSDGGNPARGRVVVVLRGGKFYLVSFHAHQQTFTTDRAALDQMLASWSWG